MEDKIKEIMKKLQTRGAFQTPEQVDQFFLKSLKEVAREALASYKKKLVEGLPKEMNEFSFSLGDNGKPDLDDENYSEIASWNACLEQVKSIINEL